MTDPTDSSPDRAGPVSLLQRIEDNLVGVLVLLALLVCMANIILRNTSSGLAIAASDEIQVYLTVWAIFLSLGIVTAGDRHIKADIFVSLLGSRSRQIIAIASCFLGLCFSSLMVYLGATIAIEAYDFGDMSSTSLRFPMWIYTAALPTGAALMAARYAGRLGVEIRRLARGAS